jgi:hypothetical protein
MKPIPMLAIREISDTYIAEKSCQNLPSSDALTDFQRVHIVAIYCIIIP